MIDRAAHPPPGIANSPSTVLVPTPPVALGELVRVAGRRWTSDESFAPR